MRRKIGRRGQRHDAIASPGSFENVIEPKRLGRGCGNASVDLVERALGLRRRVIQKPQPHVVAVGDRHCGLHDGRHSQHAGREPLKRASARIGIVERLAAPVYRLEQKYSPLLSGFLYQSDTSGSYRRAAFVRPLDRRSAPGIRADIIPQRGLVPGIRFDIRHNDVLVAARGRSQLALRIALHDPKTRMTFAPNRGLKRRTRGIAYARVPAECGKPGKIPQRGLHELVKLVPLDRAGGHVETFDSEQKLQVATDTGLQVSRHGFGALVKRDAQAVLLPTARQQEQRNTGGEQCDGRQDKCRAPWPPGRARLAKNRQQQRRGDDHADRIPHPPNHPVMEVLIGRDHTIEVEACHARRCADQAAQRPTQQQEQSDVLPAIQRIGEADRTPYQPDSRQGLGRGPDGYGRGQRHGGGRHVPASLVGDGEIHCERAEPHPGANGAPYSNNAASATPAAGKTALA